MPFSAPASFSLRLTENADDEASVHDRVYEALATMLVQGQLPPGKSVSLRTLASGLGVSPMPVREAVRRLIAQKALELQPSNKRLRVPSLTEDRLRQLMTARQWVEPELAFRAVANIGRDVITELKADDNRLMAALSKGDVDGYMQANNAFHFRIYRLAQADLFLDMAKTLWLQSGPFMRVVFGRLGTVQLPQDHHQELIRAFEAADADAVRQHMSDDIHEGMELMLEALRV